MRRLRTAHVSGKWSIKAGIFALYLAIILRVLRLDLVTTTESAGMLAAVRKRIGKKFWVRGEGEFLVIGRHSKTVPGGGRLGKITDEFDGGEDWRDTRAHYRWVRLKGAGPLLVIVSHLSSAVQAGGDWSGFERGVRSHQVATGLIGRQVQRRIHVAEVAGAGRPKVLFSADINLDLHVRRWREYMRRALGMDGCWDDTRPATGTHGRRLIDGSWSTMRLRRARVLRHRRPRALDHKSVLAVYDVPRNKKARKYRAEPARRA